MKKILFPTDFSQAADKAFIYALQFADKIDAQIITLHVYEVPDIRGVNLPNTLREVYESISLHEFANYRSSIPRLRHLAESQGLGHVPMVHVLEEGETMPAIQRVAKRDDVDLIIMGTTGASGLKEIFVGTTAASVMEKADRPVLSVPQKAIFDGQLDQIAVTTQYGELDEMAIKKTLQFANLFNAGVHCLHVDVRHTETNIPRMDMWREQFSAVPHLKFHVINHISIEAGINNFIKEHNVDILAMALHKRSIIQKLFTFSTTKKMSYHLDTPILSLPADYLYPGGIKGEDENVKEHLAIS